MNIIYYKRGKTMKKLGIRLLALTLLATVATGCASSKQENTWDKIKEKKE